MWRNIEIHKIEIQTCNLEKSNHKHKDSLAGSWIRYELAVSKHNIEKIRSLRPLDFVFHCLCGLQPRNPIKTPFLLRIDQIWLGPWCTLWQGTSPEYQENYTFLVMCYLGKWKTECDWGNFLWSNRYFKICMVLTVFKMGNRFQQIFSVGLAASTPWNILWDKMLCLSCSCLSAGSN